jgi:tRNA pseudouridine38-40 synthase
MEKNIFLEVEYVGTNYFGFQIQNKKGKNEITIQDVIEKALHKLFKKDIRIIYSSRTDRGVHAKGQVLNFYVDTDIPLNNIKQALNTFLPLDIRIKRARRVALEFHSRFRASWKIYRYIIFQGRDFSVFENNFSWQVVQALDIEKMKKAAQKLKGRRDCAVFAKSPKVYKDCLRNIMDISIKKRGSYIYVDIKADGFLRNMARNMVSFLVKAESGKIAAKDIPLILKGKAAYSNNPAPACGLYLMKVSYNDY